MKECWRDGDLRAYLDGELSPAETARVAAHLAECHECEARYDEVAGRAGMVSGLMESLAELEPVAAVRKPAPVRRWRQWAGAGAAIAAGIAITAIAIPKRPEPTVSRGLEPAIRVEAPVRTVAPEDGGAAESPMRPRLASAESRQEAAARPRSGTAAPRRQLPRDVFLALDNEPIDTGVVVRMTLGEEEIPADVVFGKDGRARAIRLIGTNESLRRQR